jgi:hypothetical protein
MSYAIQLLDVVALTEDLPARGLSRGQVGTVVESLAPDPYEVEFCDNDGRTLRQPGFACRAAYGLALPTPPGGVNSDAR